MKRVLVVDDVEEIRFILRTFLTEAGYEVTVAAHEIDAKAILSAREFDVAVVDRILSGGKGGGYLSKEIKRLQPSCEVIMITGFPTFKSASKATEDDIFAYLVKPIKREEIVRAVEEAFKI
jgi:two-component system NtrC family response regulator